MKKYIYKGTLGSSNHMTFNGVTYNFKIDGVCNYEGNMAKLIDTYPNRFEEVIDSAEISVKPKIEDIIDVLQKDDVEAFAKLDELMKEDVMNSFGLKPELLNSDEMMDDSVECFTTLVTPDEVLTVKEDNGMVNDNTVEIETLDEVIEKNDIIDEALETEDTIIIDEIQKTKIEEINNIVDEPNKSEIYLKDLHWTKLKKLAVLFNIEYTTKEETISKLKNLPIEKLMGE